MLSTCCGWSVHLNSNELPRHCLAASDGIPSRQSHARSSLLRLFHSLAFIYITNRNDDKIEYGKNDDKKPPQTTCTSICICSNVWLGAIKCKYVCVFLKHNFSNSKKK